MKPFLKNTVIALGLLGTVTAFGAEKLLLPAVKTPTVGPVDDLVDSLKEQPQNRKVLVQLSKATKLLHDLKLEAARRAASLVKSDPEFGDHARWIMTEAILLEADQDIRSKHFDKADLEARDVISAISSVALDYPGSPIIKMIARAVGRANLIQARAACEGKRWAQGRKNYEAGFSRLSGADAEAYIRPEDVGAYVQACEHHGTELCTSWLERMGLVYPHSTPEAKVLASLVPKFIERLPHPPSVSRNTSPYHAPDLDTAEFDEAMEKYISQKPKDAIPVFRKLLDEYPRSSLRFRAKYWLAQAMLKNKETEDAKKLLVELQQSSPLSYYGLLASIATDQPIDAPLSHTVPTAQDGDALLLPADLTRLRRAQALFSRKIYDEAALELADIKTRDALSTGFLIYLAALQSEAGAHPNAFRTLNEIILRGSAAIYSDFGLSLVFPSESFIGIKKIAMDFQLDPILVLSLIKQESAFDSHAISNTGALGLMQIMPATASDTVADLARTELITPEVNVRTGMKYLSQLLKRYNGNIVFALAAYNAGPGAVNRWIKGSPPDRGVTEFIEEIPFKETREYVSSIIRNYFWYAHIFAPDTAKLVRLSHFWGSVEPAALLDVLAPDTAPDADGEDSEGRPLTQNSSAPSPTPIPSGTYGPPSLSGPALTLVPIHPPVNLASPGIPASLASPMPIAPAPTPSSAPSVSVPVPLYGPAVPAIDNNE